MNSLRSVQRLNFKLSRACGVATHRTFHQASGLLRVICMERKKKSVLIIDDDPDLRYVLSLRLFGAGYMVYGGANGLEALERMDKDQVDVVLTDYHMPIMDGFEFLSICRARWPGTPVVVFSGEQEDMAHEAVDRGAFAWVRKGSEFTLLLEFLEYAIQQSVRLRAA